MGLFDFFKKKETPAVKPRNDIFSLQVEDIVTFDLEDYIVIGKLVYHDSGYEWTAYQLKGDQKNIWLAAEQDDELELGIYERVATEISHPIKNKMEIEGVLYYQEEHGHAQIREAVGQVGAKVGQRVEYWDFEDDSEEKYLSIEKWGGDLEVSKGYSISLKELRWIAGS